MLKTIRLYGHLRDRFGESFSLAVDSPREAVRALIAVVPGFQAALNDGLYYVRAGRSTGGQVDLGVEDLACAFGQRDELHLEPVPAGAGGDSGGIGKAILGAVIVVAAIVAAPFTGGASLGLGATAFSVAGATVTFGQIAMFGLMMAIGGISQMMAGSTEQQSFSQRERPDQRPSFLFNGAVNVSEQGGPVPLVYGRMLAGSVVVSSGITSEDF